MNHNTFESDNPVNFLNVLESDDLENLFNMLMPDCPEAYYKQIDNENDFKRIEEMSFNNWVELDKWLDNHGLESGFAFMITHSETNKENKIPWRHQASQSSCNKLNNDLRDNNNSEDSSDSENEANQNKRKCSICNLKDHNA
ncbi:15602_t:CDS:2 [Gigaspora margarita]|uniref:15602_t:CDS:1 n=1 Tax=Gigaspora margarita TaxID=4874 RepID=A0ABN7UGS5_GIGMA|nr:15602_t:CDS:2 [Gigaspora margarita]